MKYCKRSLVLFTLMLVCDFASAQGYKPEESVSKMTIADGYEVNLVAAEPFVRQPVSIEFDDRGRLWVIQYLQYPNPAGLKRVKVDRYSRTVYDRVPEPPPHGPRGDDKITILEDTDGDGRVDASKDFVTGLNITTGFAFGYGGVFVLNVPYLLFYPDKNRDDIPDGDPEVLLKGFGMEDTSSLANSLMFGPDGWLYGTQGTNITANIRGIEFEQGVWRYHPITKDFELFCEGGGNTWGLDFDRVGNLLYSTNYGGNLMHHGVQGSYHEKSFQKHGELHNPYAFGYFGHVRHKGFHGGHVTVGGFVYQGDSYPESFQNKYLGADLLGHAVYWHNIESHGSTFQTSHGGTLLAANDTWFAPSDLMMGPDGAVYVADWYDKRTAHPDPDADWDRTNGRIYRIQAKNARSQPFVDYNTLSSKELVDRLAGDNIWQVRRALRILGERRDPSVVSPLSEMAFETSDPALSVRYLWALHASGGFNTKRATHLLLASNEAVRSWSVRFLGDTKQVPPEISRQLAKMAAEDKSRLVISQLACSAKRLPNDDGMPIIAAIAARDEFADDPYIPLLCWWGLEAYALENPKLTLALFASPDAWKKKILRNVIAERLVQRAAAERNDAGYVMAAQIIEMAPAAQAKRLLKFLDRGLAMVKSPKQQGLPLGSAFVDIAEKEVTQVRRGQRFNSVPPQFQHLLQKYFSNDTVDPTIIRLATRLGNNIAYERAWQLSKDALAEELIRLEMLDVLGEFAEGEHAVKNLLPLVGSDESQVVQQKVMTTLGRFSDDAIAEKLLQVYPGFDKTMQSLTRQLLFSRASWAAKYLDEMEKGTYPASDVSTDELRRLAALRDKDVDALVRKHWGEIRAGTPEEKLAEIRRLSNDLRAAKGNFERGHELFKKHCGICHQLHGEGTKIGPELTTANRKDRDFLLVSMIDPNAQIRKEFLSYVVVTVDGRIVTGVLADQNAAQVTIVGAKNERTTIARSDIDEMKESPVSLMPENVLKPFGPQDIRDLFSYLQK